MFDLMSLLQQVSQNPELAKHLDALRIPAPSSEGIMRLGGGGGQPATDIGAILNQNIAKANTPPAAPSPAPNQEQYGPKEPLGPPAPQEQYGPPEPYGPPAPEMPAGGIGGWDTTVTPEPGSTAA